MDHPHRLVAQDAASGHRPFPAHDMHVGAADGGQGDLDDGLARPSRRNGDLLQADVAGAVKDKCAHRVGHGSPPTSSCRATDSAALPRERPAPVPRTMARLSAPVPVLASRWTTPPRGWTSDGGTEGEAAGRPAASP